MSQPESGLHIGIVSRVLGDTAMVHFQRSAMCAHCGACLTLDSGEMESAVKNTLSAKPGDRVSVTLSPERVVSASVIAYGVPLGFLLLGLYLGSLISDIASAALGLGLCALSYLLLSKLEKRFKKEQTYAPRMVRILTEEE